MKDAAPMPIGDHSLLYRAVLDEAGHDGKGMMEAIIRAGRRSLNDRVTDAKSVRDRHSLAESRQYLNKYESVMVERYATALRAAFDTGVSSFHSQALGSVHFDQLELMDEAQIVARVELGRAEQVVVLAVSHSLAEFNPLMCAAAGFSTVRADRNPVRPEFYVRALQTVLNSVQLPAISREHLIHHLSEALGGTLAALYAKWTDRLRGQGVQAAGYAVRPTAQRSDFGGANSSYRQGSQNGLERQLVGDDLRLQRQGVVRRVPAVPDESLLTLNKLRQLLSGELEQIDAEAAPLSFAEQFERDFERELDDGEPEHVEFASTVPAAFEALKEMQQVEHVIARIGTRSSGQAASADSRVANSLAKVRSGLRESANGLGQALSLEVVSLMVENIANDSRLLSPVQAVIRDLEPALLRLALVDPRFFSDKQHPARCLLQEITQRSLAFDAVGGRDFDQFMQPLQSILGPLSGLPIENAHPFELVLQALTGIWSEQQKKQNAQREAAVQALQLVEQRNLLAAVVASEIAAQPDVRKIPLGVADFLGGPWAQVIAHAQLTDQSGAEDPGHFRELVLALVWSAQPELTRSKVAKLTRLVPKLLSKLREGLALIDYPTVKTSEFFELLMNLHQQAFRPFPRVKEAPRPIVDPALLADEIDHWVAPSEAQASGFMEAPMELAQARTAPISLNSQTDDVAADAALANNEIKFTPVSDSLILPLGAWVELLVNDVWIRTQLSWASPHGTLFLFTSASGSTQSMTRRLRDKLMSAGTMRIIASQAVVDVALDAVVQTAMNNSIDISL